MIPFVYHPAVAARYPDLATAIVTIDGADNRATSPALADQIVDEVRAVRERLANTPLSELPSIAAWRRVFTSFGTKPTQYRNAAEALLRRITNGQDLPALNTLTDIGNLVSIRHAVPVAVLDVAHVTGTITVAFANGAEPFLGVGTDDITTADAGEVIFIDGDRVVHARRWCWRQGRAAASAATTTSAIVVIEAHHHNAPHTVDAAAADIVKLLRTYQPAARTSTFRLP